MTPTYWGLLKGPDKHEPASGGLAISRRPLLAAPGRSLRRPGSLSA